MLSIFAIGAALTNVFGRMVGDERQGWAIFAAMGVPFHRRRRRGLLGGGPGNPLIHALGIDGGNMEGKEVRFGIAALGPVRGGHHRRLCGAVNAMHDSFMPLGGMIPLINMQLGEIIFGGVGAGLYGMLLFVILAIFVAGLMVGRTPEYLGKKIEAKEVKMAVLPSSPAARHARLHGYCRGPAGGSASIQSGPARLHGGALRLHLGRREQRLRLRRPRRQHAFLYNLTIGLRC